MINFARPRTELPSCTCCATKNQILRTLRIVVCLILVCPIVWFSSRSTLAQTFDAGFDATFNEICDNANPAPTAGSALAINCPIAFTMNSVAAGTGSTSVAQTAEDAVKRRLIAEAGQSGRGGSADEVAASIGNGFSIFLSSGAFYVGHDANQFEQGYDSIVPTVTGGVDYRIEDVFVFGLAFNYTHQSADYTNGPGGFDVDSFGPRVYLGIRPFERAFANIVLGYTRQENSYDRSVIVTDTGFPTFTGIVPGENHADQYSASVFAGYDHPVGSISFGPRFGVNVVAVDVSGYQEGGTTGFQLSYESYSRTSVQTSLGAAATVATETSFGVVTSQLSAFWMHEFEYDPETITAAVVQAPGAGFVFRTESTDRDWATINLNISTVLSNGIQPFLSFGALLGNRNYEVYGGTVGFMMPL